MFTTHDPNASFLSPSNTTVILLLHEFHLHISIANWPTISYQESSRTPPKYKEHRNITTTLLLPCSIIPYRPLGLLPFPLPSPSFLLLPFDPLAFLLPDSPFIPLLLLPHLLPFDAQRPCYHPRRSSVALLRPLLPSSGSLLSGIISKASLSGRRVGRRRTDPIGAFLPSMVGRGDRCGWRWVGDGFLSWSGRRRGSGRGGFVLPGVGWSTFRLGAGRRGR